MYPNVTLRKNIFLRFVKRCSISNYPNMFNTRAGGYLCPIYRPHGVCALCSGALCTVQCAFSPFFFTVCFLCGFIYTCERSFTKKCQQTVCTNVFVEAMCSISMHLRVHTFFPQFSFLSLKKRTPVLKLCREGFLFLPCNN